jgi:hypothetical protein
MRNASGAQLELLRTAAAAAVAQSQQGQPQGPGSAHSSPLDGTRSISGDESQPESPSSNAPSPRGGGLHGFSLSGTDGAAAGDSHGSIAPLPHSPSHTVVSPPFAGAPAVIVGAAAAAAATSGAAAAAAAGDHSHAMTPRDRLIMMHLQVSSQPALMPSASEQLHQHHPHAAHGGRDAHSHGHAMHSHLAPAAPLHPLIKHHDSAAATVETEIKPVTLQHASAAAGAGAGSAPAAAGAVAAGSHSGSPSLHGSSAPASSSLAVPTPKSHLAQPAAPPASDKDKHEHKGDSKTETKSPPSGTGSGSTALVLGASASSPGGLGAGAGDHKFSVHWPPGHGPHAGAAGSGAAPAPTGGALLVHFLPREALVRASRGADLDDWNLDMLHIASLTEHHPLLYAGFVLFTKYDLFSTFKLDRTKFADFLLFMETRYHENPYHNRIHAAGSPAALNCIVLAEAHLGVPVLHADVAMATNWLLGQSDVLDQLSDWEVLALLLSR